MFGYPHYTVFLLFDKSYNVNDADKLDYNFQIQNSAFNTLGIFRLDRLFDYGNELQDVKAGDLLNRYYSYLMTVVQPRLQETNRQREKSGYLTYPFFIPKWLPNGIQT